MSRILQALAIVLLGAVGLFFFLLENPDQFKDELSQAIAANTDYDLAIDGELTWRYWPPIAIKVQGVSLLGRDSNPLAQFDQVEIDVDLIPLLTRQHIVDINLLTVKGGVINLAIDEKGQTNWQSKTGAQNSPDDTTGESPPPPTLHEFTVEGLTVHYTHDTARYEANINALHTTRLAIDAPFDISLQATLVDHTGELQAATGITGQLVYRSTNRLGFNNLVAVTTVTDKEQPYPEVQLVTDGEWHPDRTALVLNRADISLSSLKLSLTGMISLATSPRFDGKLVLESANLSQLATDLNFETPVTTLQLESGLSASTDTYHLDTLKGRFDETNFKGKLSIGSSRLIGDLRLDQLNTGLYLKDNGGSSDTPTTASSTPDSELIPISLLTSTAIDAIARIDQLHHADNQYTRTKIEIHNDKQKMSVMANTQVHGGKLVAMLNTDFTPPILSSVDLSMDRLDATAAVATEGITGTLTGNSSLRFDGTTISQLENSLAGESAFTVTDGTLDVRPLKEIAATVDTILGKQSRISTWPDTMPFELLAGQHVFQTGTSQGQVFNGQLENLHLTALGGFDLSAETLDYQVTAMFEKGNNGQFTVSDQLAGIRWPMTCQGTFDEAISDLCFGQDSAIQDLVTDIAKQDLKRRGNEKLNDIIEEKVPEELKELTRDLLKGLFK
ncbi:MAG: AsmA family protein [Gammaproteobacteria bacterium]|jgi:AsmA protein|nr:AsmA family protein [Gammaproteobacteria bacterium]